MNKFIKGAIPWNKGLIGFGNKAGFRVHGKTLNTGRTRFKKGQKPWNKGSAKYITCKFCKKVFYWPHGTKRKRKYCSKKCQSLGMRDDNHPNWKGDKVGYAGLHDWVEKILGKPGSCEHCGKTGLKGRKIHWANKSQKYLRKKSDWVRLCSSCHKKYDLNL